MRIGVFGAGGMAEALGGQWTAAGHEVMVAARDRAKAAKISARVGTWAETARASDVILLAVPAASVAEVVAAAGDLAGKTLVDCTNAVAPGAVLTVPDQAARIALAAKGAHVVKAFNLCPVEVWRMTPPVFGGRPLAVPLCGSPEGVATVSELVRDLGCTPLAAGGLDRAGLMEATMAFMVGLWFDGHDAQACFPPLPV
ncbi:NADP oxidoreductase [Amycolatopsis orientalis]|uniref:NADP oxidoreductase n=1 Tax=Amycolatopsis orientalis TaxID=31958 RepID=A0A193C8C5_AMYOR|nr:NAD(P)-binding domain-containing protein [Amycolatopsis orientalis]ANN20618.1 NADP oxidoreductase [Amycolatopsis orientalis]